MRQSRWLVGAVAVVVGYVGTSAARQDEELDLRGPGPRKGQVVVRASTFQIKNAVVTIKTGGTTVDARQTQTAEREEVVEYLTVDGRQVTRARTRVVKQKADIVTTIMNNPVPDSKDGDLLDKVFVSERSAAGRWKHALVGAGPNARQKKELDQRVGPESDDDLYPDGKVKVGHKWTVDASTLQRVFGGSISDLKGKLNLTLVRVEEVDGEACAVITSKGKVTGVAKEDDGDLKVEMDLDGTTWRSLKTGIDVKDQAKGTMRMSGKTEADGQSLDLELVGPITIEGTARLKK
ncbi:MAG TPA: hypothetical protein VD866_26955 [Urbifossiella sp.]|nr:hypothetical protein [Urbifossiella sp.]